MSHIETLLGGARRRAGRRWPLVAATAAFLLVPAAALPLPVQLPSGNLLANPGAESGPGATSDTTVAPIPGWTTLGGFTAVRYGTRFDGGSFPAAPRGGGKNFLAGGPQKANATATQRINVARFAGKIDAGSVNATLSALIGGYLDRPDNGRVSATFLGATGASLGRLTIGPVTASDRGGKTGLLPVTGTQRVPKRTRSIKVVLIARRLVGFYNDAYFDNISLKLAAKG